MIKDKYHYAIGVAVEHDDGKTLYGHRNSETSKEYKGFWSLPSISIDKDEYKHAIHTGKLSNSVLTRFAEEKLGVRGEQLKGGNFLIRGSRQRSSYFLNMAIFSGTLYTKPLKKTSKYDKIKFYTPKEFLYQNSGKCGTCVSLYFQNLIDRNILSATFNYLEVPPELSHPGCALEDYSPEDLWRLAAPNYSLLLQSKTGGEGYFLRTITLNRFLNNFIDEEIQSDTRVLDVGAGDGSFLKKIRKKTNLGYGIELIENFPTIPAVKNYIKRGNLHDAPTIFENMKFDWIILNLVLYWLPDIDTACSSIASLLSKNGKVLVVVTVPEFTKNGQWRNSDNNFTWMMTGSLRQEKKLVMINRSVGPLWFYPKSTIDILNSFGKNLIYCTGGQHIYIDSYLTHDELNIILTERPSLERHKLIPVFTVLTFEMQ